MFITITGRLGSGKSTVCGLLREKYGFEIYTTGVILRSLAEQKGMSTLEFNEFISNNENNVDEMIDSGTKKIAAQKKGDKVVFDSRMAWYFVPDSFKVYLALDSLTAAKRIMKGGKRIGEEYSNAEEAAVALEMRANVERRRFLKLYNADLFDMNNFDLVMDTANQTPEQIAERIVKASEREVSK